MRKVYSSHKVVIEAAVDSFTEEAFGYEVGNVILAITSPTVETQHERFWRMLICQVGLELFWNHIGSYVLAKYFIFQKPI